MEKERKSIKAKLRFLLQQIENQEKKKQLHEKEEKTEVYERKSWQ